MKIKKTFCLIFFSLFALTCCGKKGPLENPKDYKRPSFDKMIEEN